jgi:hypothetical protein
LAQGRKGAKAQWRKGTKAQGRKGARAQGCKDFGRQRMKVKVKVKIIFCFPFEPFSHCAFVPIQIYIQKQARSESFAVNGFLYIFVLVTK